MRTLVQWLLLFLHHDTRYIVKKEDIVVLDFEVYNSKFLILFYIDNHYFIIRYYNTNDLSENRIKCYWN